MEIYFQTTLKTGGYKNSLEIFRNAYQVTNHLKQKNIDKNNISLID